MRDYILEHKTNFKIDTAALTDCGKKRKVNEDIVFCQTGQMAEGQKSIGLYLVCDGMGGHKAGRVASQLAAGTIMSKLAELFLPDNLSGTSGSTLPFYTDIKQRVTEAIQAANSEIVNYAQKHPLEAGNMGTTVTVAMLYNNKAYIGNVGDSRAYVWRLGQLTQITQDHSLAAALLKLGNHKETNIADHPQSKVLLRALGLEKKVKVDLFTWDMKPGDKLLLCSDGFWRAFPDTAELAERLGLNLETDELCRQLVDEAMERDGSDNISAIVVNTQETANWQFNLAKSVNSMVQKVKTFTL